MVNRLIPENEVRAYINQLSQQILPETGKPPVATLSLGVALDQGNFQAASELAHNYSTHGAIRVGIICSPECLAKGINYGTVNVIPPSSL